MFLTVIAGGSIQDQQVDFAEVRFWRREHFVHLALLEPIRGTLSNAYLRDIFNLFEVLLIILFGTWLAEYIAFCSEQDSLREEVLQMNLVAKLVRVDFHSMAATQHRLQGRFGSSLHFIRHAFPQGVT